MLEEKKPSVVEKVKGKLDRAQRIFLITNVLMTLIFAANSIMGMITDFGAGVVQYVTIALLVAYVIAFVVLIVLFNKDKKNLKENMTNYKFAIKVMKKVVNLMNLALALSVMVEALTLDVPGPKQILALIASIMGIALAVFKFILMIFKFIRKKKKAAKKAEQKALKAEQKAQKTATINAKINSIKSKLNLTDDNAESTVNNEAVVSDSSDDSNK